MFDAGGSATRLLFDNLSLSIKVSGFSYYTAYISDKVSSVQILDTVIMSLLVWPLSDHTP